MRNFQGIIFLRTRIYREILKSALAYLYESNLEHKLHIFEIVI